MTSGKVVVDGYELSDSKTNLDKARENIGMVFQHFNLFPHMTVLENVTFAPVELGRMNKEEADKLAMDLLDRVGLADKQMQCQIAYQVDKNNVWQLPVVWQ